jgi:hypothetical protein
MTGDRRIRLGVVLGLAGAVLALSLRGVGSARIVEPPKHGPVLSDCDGAIRELVIQYVPEAAPIVETAYREFLGQLPPEVTVHVVCPDRAAFDDLLERLGDVACRLNPVFTYHSMTCWSRDRWLAFEPHQLGGPVVLLSPREEDGAGAWPRRLGDSLIGDDLGAALEAVAATRSVHAFDGGDFVCDSDTAFVTPSVLRRNIGGTVESAGQLGRALTSILKRPAVLLPDAPPHHAGMFMMVAGDNTVLVGDPSLAKALLPETELIDNPDFSAATQQQFDTVARTCEASGYRVVRVPVLPDRDGRTYLTCLNAILDQRGGRRIVYMPTYRGADALNAAGEAAWRDLGYEVRPIDCTATYRHFGSLRCLVNILRRAQ